jgi:hypothetical protein
MSDGPQKKIDPVSWVVGFTLAGLTVGGILAIFGAPLRALLAHG